jgi:hypothetical protein
MHLYLETNIYRIIFIQPAAQIMCNTVLSAQNTVTSYSKQKLFILNWENV